MGAAWKWVGAKDAAQCPAVPPLRMIQPQISVSPGHRRGLPGASTFMSHLWPVAFRLLRVLAGLGANSALLMGQGAESGMRWYSPYPLTALLLLLDTAPSCRVLGLLNIQETLLEKWLLNFSPITGGTLGRSFW